MFHTQTASNAHPEQATDSTHDGDTPWETSPTNVATTMTALRRDGRPGDGDT